MNIIPGSDMFGTGSICTKSSMQSVVRFDVSILTGPLKNRIADIPPYSFVCEQIAVESFLY